MKHPNREAWVPYVLGEETPETRQQLNEHLQQCPECRTEIEGWRRTLRQLDEWKIPAIARPRSPNWLPAAAAASVMLAAGLVAGGFAFHQSVQRAVAEVKTESRRELAAARNEIAALKESSGTVAAARVQAESQRLLQELAAIVNETRNQDRRAFMVALQQVQRKQHVDYLSLRRDLETVASFTDDELNEAKSRLVELAALTQK